MPEPAICFQGVEKYYGAFPVLHNIDLQIEDGEKVVLMGPSGCGKSTLLRCINALESVHRGNVTVNGTCLVQAGKPCSIDLNAFRADIGMVFQQYNLFPHLTVLQNIALGPVKVKGFSKTEAEEAGYRLLKRIGLADKALAYPDQLSGGQQQRVAIARSLAMNPKILLLDEPTSALDPLMTQEVQALMQEVAQQGMTMVMVTHAFRFAQRVAQRILFLEKGNIIETGSPTEILNNPQSTLAKRYVETLL